MEYKVINSNSWTVDAAIKLLEKKVNNWIQEGWEPIGGIVVVAFNDNVYQTLIKR